MSGKLWTGTGRYMLPVPGFLWRRQVRRRSQSIRASLSFMSEEHHLVREFAVRELPGAGKPLSAGFIGAALDLPAGRVSAVLADLEKRRSFVCMNDEGAVEWAYPVTVSKTPHKVTFSTGERLHSA